ncbi:hypothetical protein KI387_040921 [Taxus chinensis]|uniref:Uncharacterized protein n=1 Tax=Taxus chinensis TaxID=29808 RepID=A0AA38F949_TAXCH|nr:hypothetical protein KI387_040921 [Taxus chinensis]
MDKVATIWVLLEDKKDKDTEIKCLTQECDNAVVEAQNVKMMVEQIADEILLQRPEFQEKVPQDFKSELHYLCTIVHLLLDEGPMHLPKKKDAGEEATRARATIDRKVSIYEVLLQTLKDELKRADQALNLCAVPDAIIRTRTLVEDNEVLKVMKDETLGCTERLALVKQKCEALAAAQDPHKERINEIGKLIVQKMDLMEGMLSGMANVVWVLQNEKEKITQDELDDIATDILEKMRNVLSDWKTLEAELKNEYPELILPVEEEGAAE